jgi:small basic protein
LCPILSYLCQELALLYQQFGQVVILIDEYDKPMIDYLDDKTIKQAKANQKTGKAFYSVLKGLDTMLRFVFITSVSKFSKVSLFSDLNHLEDITLEEDYASIVGYTEAELTHYFDYYIFIFEFKFNETAAIAFQQILDKQYANKYRASGKRIVGIGVNFSQEKRCIDDWENDTL